eukprot:TRINITY_DN8116_c0_g1_i2.p1 TRINITY_DN8116_c0_g1~~TRINITY_DN8116_c0_g1_i2.p1  ORF type:complete len:923 (+),score=159.99 TRINITY_DN8116_c0_g1_i2:64-2832(+)
MTKDLSAVDASKSRVYTNTVASRETPTKRKASVASPPLTIDMSARSPEPELETWKSHNAKKRIRGTYIDMSDEILKQCLQSYDPSKIPKKPLEYDSWTDSKKRAFDLYATSPNIYYYYHLNDGEKPNNGKWSSEERELFIKWLKYYPTGYGWGLFSRLIAGRNGSQCKTIYHTLCKEGKIPESSQRQYRAKQSAKDEIGEENDGPDAVMLDRGWSMRPTKDESYATRAIDLSIFTEDFPNNRVLPDAFFKEKAYAFITGPGIQFPVRKFQFTIGRKSNAAEQPDLVLPMKLRGISRKHAVIKFNHESGSYEVQCLSSNGMIVGGKKMDEKSTAVALSSQTTFTIGCLVLHFLLPSEAVRTDIAEEKPKSGDIEKNEPLVEKSPPKAPAGQEGIRRQSNRGRPPLKISDIEKRAAADSLSVGRERAQPVEEPIIPQDALTKPPYTYPVLVARALSSRGNEKMTFFEILDEIMRQFPYYKYKEECQATWRASVRHALNTSVYFDKTATNESAGAKQPIRYSLTPYYLAALDNISTKFGGTKRGQAKRALNDSNPASVEAQELNHNASTSAPSVLPASPKDCVVVDDEPAPAKHTIKEIQASEVVSTQTKLRANVAPLGVLPQTGVYEMTRRHVEPTQLTEYELSLLGSNTNQLEVITNEVEAMTNRSSTEEKAWPFINDGLDITTKARSKGENPTKLASSNKSITSSKPMQSPKSDKSSKTKIKVKDKAATITTTTTDATHTSGTLDPIDATDVPDSPADKQAEITHTRVDDVAASKQITQSELLIDTTSACPDEQLESDPNTIPVPTPHVNILSREIVDDGHSQVYACEDVVDSNSDGDDMPMIEFGDSSSFAINVTASSFGHNTTRDGAESQILDDTFDQDASDIAVDGHSRGDHFEDDGVDIMSNASISSDFHRSEDLEDI